MLRWLKTVVVSDEEKASLRRQVGIGKASASESSMTCRNLLDDIKTGAGISLDPPTNFSRSFPARSLHAEFGQVNLGMTTWPRASGCGLGLLPVRDLLVRGRGAGGRGGPLGGAVTGVGAGQAARAGGGPVAASNRFIHSVSWCQPSGRCKVISPRPCRAVRAATSMRSRRMVAPLALA